MKDSKTLTTGEVAGYCGVNFRTVIRWIERGHLRSYKLPGRGDNRIKVEDFIAFLIDNNIPIPDELASYQVSENKKILVIDDDLPMAAAISRLLILNGYIIDVANNGFQAGTKLASFEPALVTLDLSMPGLNGFHVLQYIRSEFEDKIKVVVISALPDRDLAKARAQGADAVISKPYDDDELSETIHLLLNK